MKNRNYFKEIAHQRFEDPYKAENQYYEQKIANETPEESKAREERIAKKKTTDEIEPVANKKMIREPSKEFEEA